MNNNKPLKHIPKSVSTLSDMYCVVLFKEYGDSKLILLYGWINVDDYSTLVYSPHGHGLRLYKESSSVQEDLSAYLPVYLYGGFAENKIGEDKWKWSHTKLPITTVLPSYLWR